jgi:hypothetical protein
MARDTGALTPTLAAALYADPSRTFTLTDAVGTASSGIITYTATVGSADLRKIITPGSAVVITGFSNADLNFDDGNNSGINTVGSLASTSKTRAIVASVPSASTFTVVSPVTITSTTVSGASGVLSQDTAVANRPLDNGVYWLPTSANANAQIGLEWGAQMARIQPNFADGVGGSDTNRSGTTKTITAASANGTQIDFTSTSHGLSQGQYIEVTGITNQAGASLDRVNTRYVISAVSTDHIFVNSVVTGSLYATNAAAVVLTPINGTVTATSATFSTTAGTIAYTTSTPHGYVVGQTINVSGAANENFSVKNAIITTNTSTTLTVQTPISPVSAVTFSGSNAVYAVPAGHNFGSGDKVWIKNITANNSHIATTSSEATILSVAPTSFTIATGAAGVTITSADTITLGTGANYAQAFKGVNGSFSGTARVGQADAQWGQAWLIPSGTLITGQDNNELALTSPAPSGFPGYVPAYTYPNVVGAIQTAENPQAVRAFKAAGFTNVTAVEYTTNTAGASITQVVYNGSTAVYTASSHGLVVGQTVTVPSVNLTTASGTATGAGVTYNSVITTTATHTFTVANASASATVTGIVGQWVAPKGLSISAITGNAAATSGVGVITVTTATPHGLKSGDLVGIAGATTDSNYRVAYVPGSSTLTGTAVTSITSPTSFTYANSAACTATNPTVTGGLVVAYNGVAISPVLASHGSTVSPGATNTAPSVGIIVNATPAPNGTGGGTTQNSYS